MAVSKIDEILDSDKTPEEKLTAICGPNGVFDALMGYIKAMRNSLADETATLDKLMDANGDNPSEHHAKTMVFYGRKLSVRDALRGVLVSDTSHTEPPNVNPYTFGIDSFISEYIRGSVSIKWDCNFAIVEGVRSSTDNIWKVVNDVKKEPVNTKVLEQMHVIGSEVTMPSIQNLDNGGKGAGTNTYRIKSGFIVNGWTFDTNNNKKYYLADDLGNDFQYTGAKDPKEEPVAVDTRVFAFGSKSYKIPFNEQRVYDSRYLVPREVGGAPAVTFILDLVAVWFTIEFVVRHVDEEKTSPTAPYKVPIKTTYGRTITLPQTNQIILESGYEIDTTESPYGQWTPVDPNAGGAVPVDPDGDPLPTKPFNAGASYIVGTDLDAGIRRLYLSIKSI